MTDHLKDLSKTDKLIMALAEEQISVRIRDAGEKMHSIDAMLHLGDPGTYIAHFELACGVRIMNIEFKRIGIQTLSSNHVIVTLDLY